MSEPKRRALDQPIRSTRAEVDVAALEENFNAVRAWSRPAEVLAVIKANAYGHGAVAVARVLEKAGARFLGVALVEEGVELRNAGVAAPILVMGGAYEGGYAQIVDGDLTPVVFRQEHLAALAAAARQAGKQVNVHLKVDTGMGRLGIPPDALDSFLDGLAQAPELVLDGVASHLANADAADPASTREQVRAFAEVLRRVDATGLQVRWRHLSNSAAVLDHAEARESLRLNLVRPGLVLYGLPPVPRLAGEISLRPVLSWKTQVSHLKTVPVGTPVSYGSTWHAPRRSTVATLPVGYADGYSRALSNKASVLVRGRRAPVVGRVCMDMTMVDVTEVAGVTLGDEVVLLGEQGTERIGAEELAALQDTIPYEVLCGVSARVPRVAVGR